jgi:hypothetical protein
MASGEGMSLEVRANGCIEGKDVGIVARQLIPHCPVA